MNGQTLPIAHGAPIRLRDVAQTVDAAENTRLAAWANDKAAVVLSIRRQPGANVIETVDRIHALMPELRAALPSTIELTELSDRTVTIRASVAATQFELALAVVLVVLVILFMPEGLMGFVKKLAARRNREAV